MDTQRKATALRLREQDIQAILTIRQYYGITSDNQAIVLAINLIARQIEEGRAPSSQAPNKERRIPPPGFSQGHPAAGLVKLNEIGILRSLSEMYDGSTRLYGSHPLFMIVQVIFVVYTDCVLMMLYN